MDGEGKALVVGRVGRGSDHLIPVRLPFSHQGFCVMPRRLSSDSNFTLGMETHVLG